MLVEPPDEPLREAFPFIGWGGGAEDGDGGGGGYVILVDSMVGEHLVCVRLAGAISNTSSSP